MYDHNRDHCPYRLPEDSQFDAFCRKLKSRIVPINLPQYTVNVKNIRLQRLAPDHVERLHCHPSHFETVIVLEGTGYGSPTDEKLLVPGSVLIRPPGAAHAWKGGGSACVRLALDLDIELPPDAKGRQRRMEYIDVLKYRPCRVTSCPELPCEVGCLWRDVKRRKSASRYRAETRLAIIVSTLLSTMDRPRRSRAKDGTPQADDLYATIHRYVAMHAECTLENIAYSLEISPRTFDRWVHDILKTTPSALVKQLRLDMAARRLLEDRNSKIIDISFDIGFRNHSHFTKEFRERYQVSPSCYRKEAQQGD